MRRSRRQLGTGPDEIQLGDVRFIVSAGGARQGKGRKSSYMRWRLTGENGITLLLMNRDKPHATQPNAMFQVGSLPLMQHTLDSIWGMGQHAFDSLGPESSLTRSLALMPVLIPSSSCISPSATVIG
jgi:hypothetical protein